MYINIIILLDILSEFLKNKILVIVLSLIIDYFVLFFYGMIEYILCSCLYLILIFVFYFDLVKNLMIDCFNFN